MPRGIQADQYIVVSCLEGHAVDILNRDKKRENNYLRQN